LQLVEPPSSIAMHIWPPPLEPPLPVEPGTQSLLITFPLTESQQVLQIWPLASVVWSHLGGGGDGVGAPVVPQQVKVIDWESPSHGPTVMAVSSRFCCWQRS